MTDDEQFDEQRDEDAPAGRPKAYVPGQVAPDKSAAGAEQGGLSLATVHASDPPAEEGVNSSGDSVGDDDSLPGADRVTEVPD
jgi:hypothetical protein